MCVESLTIKHDRRCALISIWVIRRCVPWLTTSQKQIVTAKPKSWGTINTHVGVDLDSRRVSPLRSVVANLTHQALHAAVYHYVPIVVIVLASMHIHIMIMPGNYMDDHQLPISDQAKLTTSACYYMYACTICIIVVPQPDVNSGMFSSVFFS